MKNKCLVYLTNLIKNRYFLTILLSWGAGNSAYCMQPDPIPPQIQPAASNTSITLVKLVSYSFIPPFSIEHLYCTLKNHLHANSNVQKIKEWWHQQILSKQERWRKIPQKKLYSAEYYDSYDFAIDMKKALHEKNVAFLWDDLDNFDKDDSSRIFNYLVMMAHFYKNIHQTIDLLIKINGDGKKLFPDFETVVLSQQEYQQNKGVFAHFNIRPLILSTPEELACNLQATNIIKSHGSYENKLKNLDTLNQDNHTDIVHYFKLACLQQQLHLNLEELNQLLIKTQSYLHNELRSKYASQKKFNQKQNDSSQILHNILLEPLVNPLEILCQDHILSDIFTIYLEHNRNYWFGHLVHLIYIAEHLFLLLEQEYPSKDPEKAAAELLDHCQKFFNYFESYKPFYEKLYQEYFKSKTESCDKRIISFFSVLETINLKDSTNTTYEKFLTSFCPTCMEVPPMISFDGVDQTTTHTQENADLKIEDHNDWLIGTSADQPQKNKQKSGRTKSKKAAPQQPIAKKIKNTAQPPVKHEPLSFPQDVILPKATATSCTVQTGNTQQPAPSKQPKKKAQPIKLAVMTTVAAQTTKNAEHNPPKITSYHKRINKWFTNWSNQQDTESKLYHSFPLRADKYILQHGIASKWEGNMRYSLPGYIQDLTTDKARYVIFSITVDPQGVCYHRGFTEKNLNAIADEYQKAESWHIDLPKIILTPVN